MNEKNYKIEKCQILKKWIVFEKHGSLLIQVYDSTRRKDCEKWVTNIERAERNKAKERKQVGKTKIK